MLDRTKVCFGYNIRGVDVGGLKRVSACQRAKVDL